MEPGRSYGGACCNALLKVLYDAANEIQDAVQSEAVSAALFDEDEDDADDSASAMTKSIKSAYTLETNKMTLTTISWAQLLQRMRTEIRDIEFAQMPKITSSRRFDLNKPFSLVPENFDPKRGKRRSLLIGCNYHDTDGAELKACHDDIRSMKVRFLQQYQLFVSRIL